MSDTQGTAVAEPDIGSYFVANYPPFSVWTRDGVVRDAGPALAAPPADVPLGLYLHIPFCRKRCHFCYFRVYTDKNAQQVERYLQWLGKEWELLRAQRALAGRPLNFVYFGGGTPSFLSTRQLESLVARMSAVAPWSDADEITFECEPGTLTEAKLGAFATSRHAPQSGRRELRRPLLELNGRAHRSPEIAKSYEFARSIGFPQITIDLIAGMLGETDENWRACVARTLELEPDSVTIYQMELPFNTTISADLMHAPASSGADRGVGHAPALGPRGVRRARARRVHDWQRVHGGQGSRAYDVPLSRSPVGRRGSRRPRRRVLRPHQRRPRPERRHVGQVRRMLDRDELPLGRAYRPTRRSG